MMKKNVALIILSMAIMFTGCSVKWYKFENLEQDPNKMITCYIKAPRSNFIDATFGLKVNPKTYASSETYKHLQTIVVFNETHDTLYSMDKKPYIVGVDGKKEFNLIWRVKTIHAIFKYSVDSSGVNVFKEAKFNLKKIKCRAKGFVLH